MPASYVVYRRYEDFNWLHNILLNLFPYNLIPPIPKNYKFIGENFSTPINLKRGRFLEKFMNYLASDPIIKHSQIFFDFLFIVDEKDFNRKKKIYEKIKVKGITGVNIFMNKDSKVEIMISKEKEIYAENIKDNASININILTQLNTRFKALYNEINTVTTQLDEIASLWVKMYKTSERYLEHNESLECYKQLSNFFSNWSKMLKQQNNLVNLDIREHFKFLRKNFSSMENLYYSMEIPKSNYIKASKNLIYKKDDLFKRNEPEKWEIAQYDKIEMSKIINNKTDAFLLMCKRETLNVIRLKEFYGLVLNRIISEYERIRELNANTNKNILNYSFKKLLDINGQFLSFEGGIKSENDLFINKHFDDYKDQDKEDIFNDLNEKIKRFPFVLERNEKIISVIISSVDEKINYSIVCKNTDNIQTLENALYEKYPDMIEQQKYVFLYKGKLIKKYQTFESIQINNGDVIILNSTNLFG